MADKSMKLVIGADYTAFNKAMKDIQTGFDKFSKGLTDIGKGLSKTFTVPILGASAAITGLAVNTANYADDLFDLRDATGMSVESIQMWQNVAKLAGQDMNVVTDSITGMVRRLPQLEAEGGKATESLHKMGLTFDRLKTMQPDEMVNTLIDRLAAMPDVMERNAAGSALFGQSWKELAPILAMGKEGIAAAREEVQKLGLGMTGEQLEAANKLKASIDRLKTSLSDMTLKLGGELAPVLQETVLPIVRDTVLPVIKDFANHTMQLVRWFGDLPAPVQKFILGALALTAALGPLLIFSGSMVGSIGQLIKGFTEVRTAVLTLGKGTGILGTAIQSLAKVFTWLTGPIGIYVLAIAAAIGIGYLIVKNWDTIKAYAIAFGEALRDLFYDIGNWIIDFVNKGIAGLEKFINSIIKIINLLPQVFGYKGFSEISLGRISNLTNPGAATASGFASGYSQASRASGGTTNIFNVQPGAVSIPAKDLKEMGDVTDFFSRIQQTSRQGVE
jgi:phage-related minor tail protein